MYSLGEVRRLVNGLLKPMSDLPNSDERKSSFGLLLKEVKKLESEDVLAKDINPATVGLGRALARLARTFLHQTGSGSGF